MGEKTLKFDNIRVNKKEFHEYKLSDIYISHNNCLGHMFITYLL